MPILTMGLPKTDQIGYSPLEGRRLDIELGYVYLLEPLSAWNRYPHGTVTEMKSPISSAAWSKLSTKSFENLIFWILHREGFFSITWHGDSDGDLGHTISCQRTDLEGTASMKTGSMKTVSMKTYALYCKQYKESVTPKAIIEDIRKLKKQEADYFVLATSRSMGAAAKAELAALEPELKASVLVWAREDLVTLLENHQDLRLQIFDTTPSTNFFIRHLSEREQRFIDLEHFLSRPAIRTCFKQACRIAMSQSTLVTLAHLLVALMRRDKGVTQKILGDQGLAPLEISTYLESLVSRSQNKADIDISGLKLSVSFRSVLDTAIIINVLFDDQVLTERVLLLAILMHPTSVSVSSLNQLCSQEENTVLKTLVTDHFTELEVKLLLATFGDELKALSTTETRRLWKQFDPFENTDDLTMTREIKVPAYLRRLHTGESTGNAVAGDDDPADDEK